MANRKRQKGGKAKILVAEKITNAGNEENGKEDKTAAEVNEYNHGTRNNRGDTTPRNGYRNPIRYSERKKAR